MPAAPSLQAMKRVWLFMVKKIRKTAVLCAAALMAAAALWGCGSREAEKETGESSREERYIYVPEYRTLSGKDIYVSNMTIGEEGNIFYLKGDGTGASLVHLNLNTDESTEIPMELADGEYPSAMGRDAAGNILLGTVSYHQSTDAQEIKIEDVIIKKLSPDGSEITSLNVGDIFRQQPDFYISSMLCDGEDNYYICTGQDIFVIGKEGNLLFQAAAGQYISSMFLRKDGKIGAAYYGSNQFEMKEVSLETKGLKDVNSKVPFAYGVYRKGQDTDLLYTADGSLYTCDFGDEMPVEVLKWTDYDVNSTNVQDMAFLADGRIVAATSDFMSPDGGSELVVLTKMEESKVPEKEILTFGTTYLSYYAERDIVAFNRQNDKYRIEVKEYGDAGTSYEDKMNLFQAELTSGQTPDIIDLTYCPIPFETLVSSGVIADLNPYLDGDDKIAREDYVESVLKAYERDGKLYAIMPYFGVDVIVGKASDLGDAYTWTVEDVMAFADEKGSGAELLPGAAKSDILWMMCTMNRNLFVDEEAGTCDFTGEEFTKILEFANRFPAEANYDLSLEKFRNGETLLYSDTVTSVQNYQMYEFMFGAPVNFIGFPTFGKSGLTLSSNGTTVAMGAESANKEGVWEFIRFNLTKDRQENVGSPNGGFPALKSALEKQFENDREPEYDINAEGVKTEIPKSTWSMGGGGLDFSVDVYAATEEQTDKVMEMIEAAQPDERMEDEIFNIISEEAGKYFEGQKNAEEVSSVVQNRVQLYLNETR